MNRIKHIRQKRGIQQKELAAAVNVSQPYMHDLELGARGAKPETWQRIADALGVPVEQLKGKEERHAG